MTKKYISPKLHKVGVIEKDIVTASLSYNHSFDGDNSKILAPDRNRRTIWE